MSEIVLHLSFIAQEAMRFSLSFAPAFLRGAVVASPVLISVVLVRIASAQTADLPLKHTPRPTHPEISAEDLMTRLYIFADDSMEGRRFRTAGDVKGTNYLAAELRKLGLQPAGDSGTYFQTIPGGSGKYPGRNVLAILRGSDPALKGTYVAVGAHSDHLGTGRQAIDHDSVRARRVADARLRGTSADGAALDRLTRVLVDSLRRLRPIRRDSIANGADDDGSGSVAVLEIAEALARLPAKPKRSVLFIFNAGEEVGLVGSNYFVKHPTVPLDSIVTYINLDMVGRGTGDDSWNGGDANVLKPGRDVMVVGSRRLSTELGKLVETLNADKHYNLRFDYDFDASVGGNLVDDSDHYPYAKFGIPIVFFFTGEHIDYHSVTDEPQYIDYPHMTKITKYIYDLALELATRAKRPVIDQSLP